MRRADAQAGRKNAGYHLGKIPHLAPALLPKHHQCILSTVMFAYSVMTKEALRFELTPKLMSLFDKNQKMRKPDKAALARSLKACVAPVEQPPLHKPCG